MPLKTVTDTLDGFDDAVKGFYVEKDGKYVLDVEGVDDHPEVGNLKRAYEATKADKAKAADRAKALEAQLADMAKNRPDEAAIVAERTKLEQAIAERDARIADLSGKITGITRDRALDEALAGAGITNATYLKAARALISPLVKVEGESLVVETGMGPKGLGDFVKSWVASEGKDFVQPANGGGARGGDKGAGGKTIAASELEAMSPAAKAEFFKANPGARVII